MNDTFNYIIKKYNLTIGKEFYIEIPNIGRNDLAKLFAELGYKVGAEVGVAAGLYSEVLCRSNPNLLLYCIDPWIQSAYAPENIEATVPQGVYDTDYEKTKAKLIHYNCAIVRETSLKAAELFPDNSFDFVYIDANHDFVNVTNDIDTWKKKVRPGGILSGHDYCYYSYRKFNHVKRVVETYFRCYRMMPYFVAGSFEVKKGEVRDRYRSWFWVKQ
jgi:hypothetical protein